jgi:citrate lyase subunit gamma (acyl carrier protein)
MEITKPAAAGTLESSDALVTIEPATTGITISITSSVIHQYGNAIKATIMDTLARLEITNAKITVVDKGALDCTLKARLEAAAYRANGIAENIPWGGAIK